VARKKMKKEEKKEKKEEFDFDSALESVNPLLREGFERFIFKQNIIIKTREEFDYYYNAYGGL